MNVKSVLTIMTGGKRASVTATDLSDLERIERQQAAISAAAEAIAPTKKTKVRKPAKANGGVTSAAPVALLTAEASGALPRVMLPSGRVAEHGWEALRPASLSPIYQALDALSIERILATETSRTLDADGSILGHIAPEYAEEHLTYYRLGSRFYTTLVIKKWPNDGWQPHMWRNLFGPSTEMSIHYYRQPRAVAEKDLRSLLGKLQLRANDEMAQGLDSAVADTNEKIKTLQSRLHRVTTNAETLFHVAAYFRIGADSIENLQREVARARAAGSAQSLLFMEPLADQRDAFVGSMPYGVDYYYKTRDMIAPEAARTFPFITREHIETDKKTGKMAGVLYGVHMYNQTPVVINPFGPPSRTTVLGQPGSGKSYWIRCHLGRLAMTGVKIIVVDPMNDYGKWVRDNRGQVIQISPDPRSKYKVNPLKREVIQKIDSAGNVHTEAETATDASARLKPIFRLLLGRSYEDGNLDGLLGNALVAFYDRYGEEEHLMTDLVDLLEEMNRENVDHFSADVIRRRSGLIDEIRLQFITGDYKGFFDTKTNVKVESDKIVFDLFHLQHAGKAQAFAAYLAMTMARRIAAMDTSPKILVVDEIHRLFQIDDAGPAIKAIFGDFTRTHRHWNTALLFATQFVSDEATNLAQKDVLATQTDIWIMLRATETMLRKAVDLVGASADLDLVLRVLKVDEDLIGRADDEARQGLIIRSSAPIPFYSIGLEHEDEEDDHQSAVRAAG